MIGLSGVGSTFITLGTRTARRLVLIPLFTYLLSFVSIRVIRGLYNNPSVLIRDHPWKRTLAFMVSLSAKITHNSEASAAAHNSQLTR